jgi:magnesium-transporting ATPase (P-type)
MAAVVQGRVHRGLSRVPKTIVAAICTFTASFSVAAETLSNLTGADSDECGFLIGIQAALNTSTIALVIAVLVVAVYLITFRHKFVKDVAPFVIGGLLIAAVCQITIRLIDTSSCIAAPGIIPSGAHLNPAKAV